MFCEFDMTHVETCHYRKKFMTCTNVNGSLIGGRNIEYPHSTVAVRLILQGTIILSHVLKPDKILDRSNYIQKRKNRNVFDGSVPIKLQ